jgi:hypothetical protein
MTTSRSKQSLEQSFWVSRRQMMHTQLSEAEVILILTLTC